MAVGCGKDYIKEFEELHALYYKRIETLSRMDEGLVKDWIVELSAENIELSLRLAEAHKQLGSSAFNPVHI